MKTLALILSLHLILTPVVYANNAGDQFRAESTKEESGMMSSAKGFFKKQMLAVAYSSFGGGVILSCSMAALQPSLMLFMAGSVTHLMAEFQGGKDQKNLLKMKAEKLKMLESKIEQGGNVQRESIDAALRNEEELLRFTENRISWMSAVQAMYTAAAAMAFFEFILSLPPPPFGPGILKPDIGVCVPAVGLPVSLSYGTAFVLAFSFASGGMSSAAMTAGSGYLIAKLFPALIPAVDIAISTPLNFALGRAAVFGAGAALIGSVVSDLNQTKAVLQSNITLLNKVKNNFENETNTNIGLATNTSTGENRVASELAFNALKENNKLTKEFKNEIKTLAQTDRVKDCLGKNGNNISISSSNCLNPLKMNRVSFPQSNIKIPDSIKNTTNLAVDLANASAQGDVDQANLISKDIASNALRLDSDMNNLLREVNKNLKAQGKPEFNFEEEKKKILAGSDSAFDTSLKSINTNGSGFTDKDLLASVSGLGLSKIKSDTLKDSDSNRVNSLTQVNSDKLNNDNQNSTKGSSPSFSEKMSNLQEVNAAYEKELEKARGVGAKVDLLSAQNASDGSAAAMNKYKNAKDISLDTEQSIFDQVTNRYFMNYSKFFEKKKSLDSATP